MTRKFLPQDRTFVKTCLRAYLYRSGLAAVMALLGFQGLVSHAQAAQNSGEAMLIFDASRSMWGKIGDKSRIVVAREVLGKAFERHENNLKLGIMAYGNRSHSNCGDINQIKSMGRINAVSYGKALRRINPRGKTPIARAIRLGATRMDFKNKKTTLILMSDGLDNCNGNACMMAKNLEESADFLTIHVIAFAMPKEDHPGLSCIARNTGGKFFIADNGPELGQAFDRIVQEISSANVPLPVAAPRRNSLAADKLTAVRQDTDAETRKLLQAMQEQARKNAEIENPPPTDIITTRTLGGGKIITIERSNQSEIAATLIENPVKPNVLLINKDTKKGVEGLELSARLASNSPVLTSNIRWEIYNFVKSSDGNRAQIATSDVARPMLPLTPGKYIVRTVFGASSTAKVIKISTAQITDATFILNTGGIRVKPLLIAGDPPAGKVPQQWIYLAPQPESLASPEFVATANNPEEIHQLNAGTYELISKFGTLNAIVKTNVTVSPGLLTEVEVSHKAGIVQFKLFTKWRGGEELKDVTWNLSDTEGNEIASNLTAGSGEIIAPGRYKVTAHYNGKIYTETFTIKPGKKKLVRVATAKKPRKIKRRSSKPKAVPAAPPTPRWRSPLDFFRSLNQSN